MLGNLPARTRTTHAWIDHYCFRKCFHLPITNEAARIEIWWDFTSSMVVPRVGVSEGVSSMLRSGTILNFPLFFAVRPTPAQMLQILLLTGCVVRSTTDASSWTDNLCGVYTIKQPTLDAEEIDGTPGSPQPRPRSMGSFRPRRTCCWKGRIQGPTLDPYLRRPFHRREILRSPQCCPPMKYDLVVGREFSTPCVSQLFHLPLFCGRGIASYIYHTRICMYPTLFL